MNAIENSESGRLCREDEHACNPARCAGAGV